MLSMSSSLNLSSDSPVKSKPKAKAQRKWGDEPVTESDMASLDFSTRPSSPNRDAMSHNLEALVDQSSLGVRTRDGLYEVKDWEFSNGHVVVDPVQPESRPISGSLGALGSLFSRLTGSKVLTQEDLKPVLDGMKQHLMKKNVAKEIADKVCEGVGESLVGKKVGGFQSLFFPTLCHTSLTYRNCSHKCSRAGCVGHFYNPYFNAQDVYRPLTLYQDEVIFSSAFDATTDALFHRFCWGQRGRKEHESVQGLFLVGAKRPACFDRCV